MQRKRHINFKDFLIRFSGHRKTNLHSIPILSQYNNDSDNKMKNNVKSSVLYSIPCGCVFTLLLSVIFCHNIADAITICNVDPVTDVSAISPVTDAGTPTPATASLSLSNTNMSQKATPGSTAIVSTNVEVSVGNAENYSLSLAINDSTNMVNGSTIIVAGNPDDSTKTNVWGYKWDNASSYAAPTTASTTLTNSTSTPLDSNGAVSFTKNLTFAAKFASDANPGTYHAEGMLSLAATPKAAALITLDNLTQMQQLTLAPEACANTPYLDGLNYSKEYTLTDVRDNSTYTVRKLGDGKCWMTQNLALNSGNGGYSCGGRTLSFTTSDVSTTMNIWTVWSSPEFANNAAADIRVENGTGYYSWCSATATTCSGATSKGANAPSSICPKGWKLPTGMVTGANTSNDFYNLFKNMNLTISGSLSATSSTSWGAGDLAIAQGSPYNFAYSGYVNNGSLRSASSEGFWWSRTASSSDNAYNLTIRSGYMHPGTDSLSLRQYGFAVRGGHAKH